MRDTTYQPRSKWTRTVMRVLPAILASMGGATPREAAAKYRITIPGGAVSDIEQVDYLLCDAKKMGVSVGEYLISEMQSRGIIGEEPDQEEPADKAGLKTASVASEPEPKTVDGRDHRDPSLLRERETVPLSDPVDQPAVLNYDDSASIYDAGAFVRRIMESRASEKDKGEIMAYAQGARAFLSGFFGESERW